MNGFWLLRNGAPTCDNRVTTKDGPGGAGNTVTPGLTPEGISEAPMSIAPRPPSPRQGLG